MDSSGNAGVVNRSLEPGWQLAHWQLLALVANLICLFADGYGADLAYWRQWIEELKAGGYAQYTGNYPPLSVHWFYLCGWLSEVLSLPLTQPLWLKAIVVLPVVFTHLLLVRMVYQVAAIEQPPSPARSLLLAVVALNPAILLDGPVWGQLDLLPVMFVVAAVLCWVYQRFTLWIMPLFTLALLTKFQMIAFTPIFAAIFYGDFRRQWTGALAALFIAGICLLPFWIGGALDEALRAAYLQTVDQYAVASLYAANLWGLLYPNGWPDSYPVLPVADDSLLGMLVSIKIVGIVAFLGLSSWLYLAALAAVVRFRRGLFERGALLKLPDLALLAAISFFLVLPEMHERYLFPAVPLALIVAALNPSRIRIAAVFTGLVFLNILMVMGVTGEHLWRPVSAVVVLASGWAFARALAPFHADRFATTVHKIIASLKVPVELVLLGGVVLMCTLFLPALEPDPADYAIELSQNQVWLTDLQPERARQDWGQLQIDANANGQPLVVDGFSFRKGLGTHANAAIEYALDARFDELRFRFGLDDQFGTGAVSVRVMLDDRRVWSSGRVAVSEVSEEISIRLTGGERLVIEVNSLGSIDSDHVNILNPVLVQSSAEATTTEPR